MGQSIDKIYNMIISKLNDAEKEHIDYLLYTTKGFVKYTECYDKEFLSLHISIKENRKQEITEILEKLNLNYNVIRNDCYYMIFEITKNKNYIICEIVVNSHVIIPQSFLKHFARKSQDKVLVVDYIDTKDMNIKEAKIKKYGIQYGYYSKYVEKYLSDNFECKIAIINKKINEFRRGKIKTLKFTKEMLEDIYDFFDITAYRNPKIVEEINKDSLSSRLIGGYRHNDIMMFLIGKKYPHIFKEFEFNIIINKTNRDFVISEGMISSILCDNKNEIIIMPISKKECLALMEKEYYSKYVQNCKNNYISIEKEADIGLINKYIFRYARYYNENIIGSSKELGILLK